MQLPTAIALLLAASGLAAGQTTVTIAGTGKPGHCRRRRSCDAGEINNPYGLTIGPDGALYILRDR